MRSRRPQAVGNGAVTGQAGLLGSVDDRLDRPETKPEPNGYLASPQPSDAANEPRDELSSIPLSIVYTYAPILALVFGGCCANVFALEAIIKTSTASGTLITAVQFLLTSFITLFSHLDFSRGISNFYLKPRAVPFQQWIIYTTFFLLINVLNNIAFDYKISVPLHIILRSAGPVTTMIVGYLYGGRRYRPLQIIAVCLLFLGVTVAALADAQAKGAEIKLAINSDSGTTLQFWQGFGILYLALILSAVMGILTDQTYAKYGRGHTQENLFYSHTLSLPFFLLRLNDLATQGNNLMASESFSSYYAASVSRYEVSNWIDVVLAKVPVQFVFLLLNACTQYLCIKGVNQLYARSSSLTVAIVLNIRKLVSLLLSIWLFGNRLAPGVLAGAAIVFIGVGLYSLPRPSKQPSGARLRHGPAKKEL